MEALTKLMDLRSSRRFAHAFGVVRGQEPPEDRIRTVSSVSGRTRHSVLGSAALGGWLLRWIGVLFAPSFVLLPLSPSIGIIEVFKIIAVLDLRTPLRLGAAHQGVPTSVDVVNIDPPDRTWSPPRVRKLEDSDPLTPGKSADVVQRQLPPRFLFVGIPVCYAAGTPSSGPPTATNPSTPAPTAVAVPGAGNVLGSILDVSIVTLALTMHQWSARAVEPPAGDRGTQRVRLGGVPVRVPDSLPRRGHRRSRGPAARIVALALSALAIMSGILGVLGRAARACLAEDS
ncbi:hypothetical protein DL767_007117 [Monosporascus sp. MG133]|nr:hypothetical protein DL767_007117 [Monosporascus sp. MG133]